ncbi:LytTR family transcriptional regulator [Lactiplantibacillus garii]|uniref:LytTR family transcriptional regulator n=1 Tax=Lactiplantibacillus garii TaxID=2306423 RepID=A0A426D4Z7_9LACO|nr:LytTR family DNA-binding domain-containing protein [Lactiplantibacillus garii]RRK09686.1 LytTR family transcriptional regulator [Lactiplantibacillus garii]
MKIEYDWRAGMDRETLYVTAHPSNRQWVTKLLHQEQLTVQSALNGHTYRLDYHEIVTITALTQQSCVRTLSGQTYYVAGRLKALQYLAAAGLMRINNTTILNLALITNFGTEKYARLVVETTTGQQLIVSRHYAKQIREALLCTKR